MRLLRGLCIHGLIQQFSYYLLTIFFFLFLYENICCGYLLEVSHLGASDEYPQHMFYREIIKLIKMSILLGRKKKKCLILNLWRSMLFAKYFLISLWKCVWVLSWYNTVRRFYQGISHEYHQYVFTDKQEKCQYFLVEKQKRLIWRSYLERWSSALHIKALIRLQW